MQLSLHKLLTSSNLFTSVQQISLQPSSSHSEVNAISNSEVHENAEPHFGYQGPGVYHLLSLVDRYQLSLGNQGSGDGVSTVVWNANETQRQLWFVSDVGDGHVSLANNATGALLTAKNSHGEVPTFFITPGILGTHWAFAEYTDKEDNPYNATRLRSVTFPKEVLVAYKHVPHTDGTPVHVWPTSGSGSEVVAATAAAWLFHYMGPH